MALLLLLPTAANSQQQTFLAPTTYQQPTNGLELHGNFLHITDMHPDAWYRIGGLVGSACHDKPRKRKDKGKELAGPLGVSQSDCDAPFGLLEATLDWIGREWKDKIDFVIWTGDNARHDSDSNLPRTRKEIYQLNQRVADLMEKTFGFNPEDGPDQHYVPIVPSFGNNDCYPHNIFYEGGPTNPTIRRFLDIWRPFIPYDQLHTFQSGGYFAVDVIPGKIRVLALNTLYFYNSNAAVDGCDARGDPGRLHMVWLDTQLELARQLKLKVHITGHVPPRPKAYYSSCLREYTRIAQEYSDIIVGHWYGHVNMDHFVLLDEKDDEEESDDFLNSKEDVNVLKNIPKYLEDLHKRYRRGVKPNASEQVVINISPPVLPVYLPTFRIIRYNVDDIESPAFGDLHGYSQYFSNVTYWNNHQPKKLETLQKRGEDEDDMVSDAQTPVEEDSFRGKKKPAHSKKKPKKPKQGPMPYLEFQLEYTTEDDLGMKDLSRDSWVDLARRLTRKSKVSEKFWRSYVDNIFVQTMRNQKL
ncbi:Metallo-dependent phosphatase-like protein [Umbelopsis sp. AD052]|nr:Metallo-dependent phosphatase-like protein [Umbelopsis sp. AD052]